jgi:hypothetical protein
MAVGRPASKGTVDETMADLASAVLALIDRIGRAEKWNAVTAQAALETDFGYTTNEAFLIKSVLDRLTQATGWLQNGPAPTDTHDTAADLAQFVPLDLGGG